jgi:small subunit ribosomal protein S15
LIKEYATGASDTGSPEVQVAILSERIANLTAALQGPRQGQPLPARSPEAGQPAAQPSRLPQKTDGERYRALIERLGLRH